MDNTYFGKIIIDRRRELDMKQEDLCRGICSRQTLSRIENGRHKPSRFIAEALLTRLDLPVSYYINQPTYEEYMQICMDLLAMADVIVQMPGWEKSCGCNRELGWAIASDKIIIQLESLFKEGQGE